MAAFRVTAAVLWALPLAAVAALAAWTFWDFLSISQPGVARGFGLVLLVGLGLHALGLRFETPSFRRFGLLMTVGSYFAAHLSVLPLDPAPALGYLTLALVTLELRVLADRFAPLYTFNLQLEDHARVTDALRRSATRLAAVSAVAFLGSYLATDLALAGTLPLRSITTALLLSAALIGVVLLLALWPVLQRRTA